MDGKNTLLGRLNDIRYELEGIAADVDAGGTFDAACRAPLRHAIDLMATVPIPTTKQNASLLEVLSSELGDFAAARHEFEVMSGNLNKAMVALRSIGGVEECDCGCDGGLAGAPLRPALSWTIARRTVVDIEGNTDQSIVSNQDALFAEVDDVLIENHKLKREVEYWKPLVQSLVENKFSGECDVKMYSSRACELGTRGCETKHLVIVAHYIASQE